MGKAHTLAKDEAGFKMTQKSLHEAQSDVRSAEQAEKESKSEVKTATDEKASVLSQESMKKKEAVDARNEKIASKEDETMAKQTQETGAKVAERYRTLSALVEERGEKRKGSQTAVNADEKSYKAAQDEADAEKAKCQKLKDANSNVGKAMAQLQQEMTQWSQKNPWLKQEDTNGEDDSDGTDPDPDVNAELGDSIGRKAELEKLEMSDPYAHDPRFGGDMMGGSDYPPYMQRIFLELVQEDYGTDVESLLRSR